MAEEENAKIANPAVTEAKPEESVSLGPKKSKPKKKEVQQPQEQAGAEPKAEAQTEEATKEKAKNVTNFDQLLFEKYSTNVEITDPSMQKYVRFTNHSYPNIYGRRKYQAYYNTHISIVERLVNKLMRGGTGKKVGGKVIRTKGRLQGKKIKVMHIVENAFEIIEKKSAKNPVQVLVDAMQNAAPVEDVTRVRYGGISYNVAVGISARSRIDVALKNIALAALIGAFRKKKSLSEALADELMLTANKSAESYAIKKRTESERIARRAR